MLGLLSIVLLMIAPSGAAAGLDVQVSGQKAALQHEPLVQNGRTLVAAEDLALLLNGQVTHGKKEVTLAFGKRTMVFQIDHGKVQWQQKWHTLEQGAVSRAGTVYLPLRWTVEQLGGSIKWEAQTRMVQIEMNKSPDQFVLLSPESLTEAEKAFVEKAKRTKGIHQQGNLFVIARGQSPNPGYGLAVVKQELTWEQLKVYVKLTEPEPGKMYAQVITYPVLVGKANLSPYTTIQFLDAATGQPLFP